MHVAVVLVVVPGAWLIAGVAAPPEKAVGRIRFPIWIPGPASVLGGLVILNIAATGFATRWGSGAVGLPSSAVLNLALLWGSLLMVSGRRSRSAPEGTHSP